ncbi:MAG: hypothetical protein M3463_18095, partial [Verrucomicrobiota bacterium]|nr:hypothetical protein [Verrucomicrobiota bacterium]
TIASLLLFATFALVKYATAQELPSFGRLPQPGNNWKLDKEGRGGPSQQWAWVVFKNSDTGDLLSFAAHVLQPGEGRELTSLSDTAHELLPGGHYSPPADTMEHFTIWKLRKSVTKFHVMNQGKDLSRETLEYTFVQEDKKGGSNRMAHGYAFIFDDVSVYVQHTSTRPITYELANDMAAALISSRAEQPYGVPAPK